MASNKKTIIAYIPALHRGYVDFLSAYPGATLYVLDRELVKEIPPLERDIRAMEATEIKKAIDGLGLSLTVEVLTKKDVGKIKTLKNIVMPDEDVSYELIKKYAPKTKVTFVPVFLRWDRKISTTEFVIAPDRIISTDEFDREIMKSAQAESAKSSDWWRQIGAIIVKNGKPILIGHNHPLLSDQVHNIFGDPRSNFNAGENIELSKFIHGEASLIAHAARKGIALEGTSLYCTVFPCPVCAKSIAAAGIKKVYYALGYSLLDAEDILKKHTIEIVCVKPK